MIVSFIYQCLSMRVLKLTSRWLGCDFGVRRCLSYDRRSLRLARFQWNRFDAVARGSASLYVGVYMFLRDENEVSRRSIQCFPNWDYIEHCRDWQGGSC